MSDIATDVLVEELDKRINLPASAKCEKDEDIKLLLRCQRAQLRMQQRSNRVNSIVAGAVSTAISVFAAACTKFSS